MEERKKVGAIKDNKKSKKDITKTQQKSKNPLEAYKIAFLKFTD